MYDSYHLHSVTSTMTSRGHPYDSISFFMFFSSFFNGLYIHVAPANPQFSLIPNSETSGRTSGFFVVRCRQQKQQQNQNKAYKQTRFSIFFLAPLSIRVRNICAKNTAAAPTKLTFFSSSSRIKTYSWIEFSFRINVNVCKQNEIPLF